MSGGILDHANIVEEGAADVVDRQCRMLSDTGLPALYVLAKRTTWPGASPDEEPSDHLLVDLLTDGIHGEFDEERVLRVPGLPGKVVQRSASRRLGPEGGASTVRAAIAAVSATHLLERTFWLESDGLWSGDMTWSYYLDATCPWPTWTLLGLNQVPEGSHGSRGRSSESSLDDALEHVGVPNSRAIHVPCTALRCRQDLLRIDRSRVRPGPPERLEVYFALGTLGGYYVQNNRPTLEYEVLGRDREVHTSGLLDLDMETIRDGATIDCAVPNAEVFAARLVLKLNDATVDWSDANYIRSISVSVRTTE